MQRRNSAVESVALGAILALAPLLPVGPRLVGVDWPNAIEVLLLGLLTVWLIVRPWPRRSGGSQSAGPVDEVWLAWAAFFTATSGATLIGLAAENRLGSEVFERYLPELWSRAVSPEGFTSDPVYPARIWLTHAEGFFAFTLVLGLCRRAGHPGQVIRAGSLGALTGLAAVSVLAIGQFFTRYQLDPRWVLANPAIVRASATLEDPNTLGSYLVLGIGLALGILCSERTVRIRRAALTTLAIAVGALFATGSRTGLGAAFLSVLLVVAFAPKAPGTPAGLVQRMQRHRRVARRGLAVVFALASALVVARLVLSQSIPDRPASRLAVVKLTLDPYVPWRWVFSDRLAYGRAAVRMAAEHPMLGVGVGRYPRLLPQYREYWLTPENTHNFYLQVLAETGVLGATVFICVLVAAARRLGRAVASADETQSGFAFGGLLGLVAFSITLLTGHPLVVPSGQILFGSTLALWLAGLAAPASTPWFLPTRQRHLLAAGAITMAAYSIAAWQTPPPPHAERVWGYEWGLYPEEWGFLPEQFGLPLEPDNPIPGPQGTRWGRFRWSRAQALVELLVPSDATECVIRFSPFLPLPGTTQDVRISHGSREEVTSAQEPRLYSVRVDVTAERLDASRRLVVRLDVHPTFSPRAVGASDDRRELGIQLFRPQCLTGVDAAAVARRP